ncbi:hypothetical protein GX51_08333, partial [Blastomyces parvus]
LPSHPLLFDEVIGAILCTQCLHAITYPAVKTHLQLNHKFNYEDAIWVTEFLPAPAHSFNYTSMAGLGWPVYSLYVKIHFNEFECVFPKYEYYCLKLSTIHKHTSTCHRNEDWNSKKPKYISGLTLSNLFPSRIKYYPVTVPTAAENTHTSDKLLALKDTYAIIQHQVSVSLAIASKESSHMTGWDKWIKYLIVYKDQDMTKISSLSHVSLEDDAESYDHL